MPASSLVMVSYDRYMTSKSQKDNTQDAEIDTNSSHQLETIQSEGDVGLAGSAKGGYLV